MISTALLIVAPAVVVVVWLVAIASPGTWFARVIREPEDRMLLAAGSVASALWFAAWLVIKVVPASHAAQAVTAISAAAFLSAFAAAGFARLHVRGRRDWVAYWRTAIPVGLLLLAAFLVTTGLGLLWSGPGTIVELQAYRYLDMPTDHLIPIFFADGLRGGGVPSPLLDGWYSADRPPLQTGFLLLFTNVLETGLGLPRQNTDAYISIVCQTLFVVAVFRFARCVTQSRAVGAVCAVAVILVPATGIYMFFTWPKLLAAAYVLTAFSLTLDLLRSRARPARGLRWIGGCFGLAAALALLSHGASIFTIVPVLVVFAAACIRRTESRPQRAMLMLVGGIAAAVTYLPWLAYGKLTGEDHGRLIKWHLAGNPAGSLTPTLTDIWTAYGNLTLADIVAAKRANFETLFHAPSTPTTLSDLIALLQDAPSWRFAEFQCLLLISGIAVVWLVPLGALILSPRRRRLRPLLQTTWLTLAVAVASLTLWCLLMFSGGATIPHQGSIILIFLPTLLCALLVSALSLRIGIVVLIVQAAVFAYLMIPPSRMRFDAIPADYAPSPVALLVLALGIACGLAGLVAASVADRKGR